MVMIVPGKCLLKAEADTSEKLQLKKEAMQYKTSHWL